MSTASTALPYLTPSEVAKLLMVSPITVRQWAQKGWLRAKVTPGGHRRFQRDEVERFARKRGLNLHTPEGSPTRLLIVDDDRALVGYLTELLSGLAEPLSLRAAHDGFEAGRIVQAFQPQVMLLDLMMPGLDGFSVCEVLKQDPATRAIRIVAMTGYPTAENRRRILQAGAETCLCKPFETAELLEALHIPWRDSGRTAIDAPMATSHG